MELTINHLGKQYRHDFWGLKDFNIQVQAGIVGLLGPNGAGKSTFMRMLATITIAGFLVAILTGSGVALHLLFAGDSTGLLAWVVGAVFIPSMALALGVWSGNSKVFEVLYISLWYIGPLNKFPALDYLGASGEGYSLIYLGASLALLAMAFIGRARQLQN